IVCADSPAFAGNRIGFKVLNEVAQLAEQHGVQLIDTLVGPYTGRAMAPLATIDLVGWDVHQAGVETAYDNVKAEALQSFRLATLMAKQMQHGHLGDKTPLLGGFYRRVSEEGKSRTEVLDPATGRYNPLDRSLTIDFVEHVRDLHHRGKYRE